MSKKRKRKKTFFIPISSKDAAKEVCPEISSITTARDIYQFVILSYILMIDSKLDDHLHEVPDFLQHQYQHQFLVINFDILLDLPKN